MNPATTLSKAQITEIFRHHGLAENPEINRITIGFVNEVHRVDDYILKICVLKDNEPRFDKEVHLYEQLLGKVLVPELVVSDKSRSLINNPYMIYKRIEGQPLASRWHKISDVQRKALTGQMINQIKLINDFYPDPKLDESWRMKVTSEINERLAKVENILPAETIERISDYIRARSPMLEQEVLGFINWDVHFDNVIINERDEMVGIIDLEQVSVVSLDYLVSRVRFMTQYPKLLMSKTMEPFAKTEDYQHLLEWYEEFYPELFDFPNLKKRLDLYDLSDILKQLTGWPSAAQLHDRLAKILN